MTKVKREKRLARFYPNVGRTFAVFASSVLKMLPLLKALASLENFCDSSKIHDNSETFLSRYFGRLRYTDVKHSYNTILSRSAYVTVFWKTDHLRTRTDIHVLPVHDRHTHALSRNTKHLTIDSQVCFYRWLFIDAVKPRGCISWPWGASIALHGTPGCSSRQSWPPLCIVTVCAAD